MTGAIANTSGMRTRREPGGSEKTGMKTIGITELEAVEAELAKRLGIQGDPRSELVRLAQTNQLVEDELVARWHELYAWELTFS